MAKLKDGIHDLEKVAEEALKNPDVDEATKDLAE